MGTDRAKLKIFRVVYSADKYYYTKKNRFIYSLILETKKYELDLTELKYNEFENSSNLYISELNVLLN